MRQLTKWLVTGVNVAILIQLVFLYISGNDKAIFVLIIGPPTLSLLNFVFAGILSFVNKDYKRIFIRAAIGVLILYLPILFIIPIFW